LTTKSDCRRNKQDKGLVGVLFVHESIYEKPDTLIILFFDKKSLLPFWLVARLHVEGY